MFVIKYDKISMVRLINCIEKYPAVYNTKQLFSKEEVDEAWDKIALEVGEKDSLCRERWTSIKSCYVRHLKYSALNSKRKPYYLAEYLDFLDPFVLERIRSLYMKRTEYGRLPNYLKEALPPAQSSNSHLAQSVYNEGVSGVKTETVENEKDEDSQWSRISCKDQHPTSSKTTHAGTVTSCSKRSEKMKQTTHISSNEDVEFFKSLLPDISKMSSHQKLKFKQETLSIIEDILYANDEVVCT